MGENKVPSVRYDCAMESVTSERLENEASAKMDEDPWAHRTAKMRCKSCMWWVRKGMGPLGGLGRCRRHAPTMGGYPVVFNTDWCGDHKLDETKI